MFHSRKSKQNNHDLEDNLTVCTTESSEESQETPVLNTSKEKAEVRFGSVHVREYDRIPGDHPNVSEGVPLTFGWDYNQNKDIPVDVYETTRQKKRRAKRQDLKLDSTMRKFILIQLFEVPQYQILAAEKEVQHYQASKAKSCRLRSKRYRSNASVIDIDENRDGFGLWPVKTTENDDSSFLKAITYHPEKLFRASMRTPKPKHEPYFFSNGATIFSTLLYTQTNRKPFQQIQRKRLPPPQKRFFSDDTYAESHVVWQSNLCGGKILDFFSW